MARLSALRCGCFLLILQLCPLLLADEDGIQSYTEDGQTRWVASSHRRRLSESSSYIAACMVFKDENKDVVEWLEYHRWLGFGRVYLYDHDSKEPALWTVMPFIKDNFVEYAFLHTNHSSLNRTNRWPNSAQGRAYNDCLARARGKHRWLMYFDVDEFLIITDKQNRSLHTLMKGYEEFAGLGVNWIMFSGKPHVKRPKGGMLASYKYTYPIDNLVHRHVKVISNPAVTTVVPIPHQVFYNNPKWFTVDELKRKVNGPFTQTPTHSIFALHHYFTRSDEDFANKIRKGSGDGSGKAAAFRNSTWLGATSINTFAFPLAKVCCPSLRQNADPDGEAGNATAGSAEPEVLKSGGGGSAAAAEKSKTGGGKSDEADKKLNSLAGKSASSSTGDEGGGDPSPGTKAATVTGTSTITAAAAAAGGGGGGVTNTAAGLTDTSVVAHHGAGGGNGVSSGAATAASVIAGSATGTAGAGATAGDGIAASTTGGTISDAVTGAEASAAGTEAGAAGDGGSAAEGDGIVVGLARGVMVPVAVGSCILVAAIATFMRR